MNTETMITELNTVAEKHKNDFVPTFQTNITAMCRDIIPKLEQLAEYEKIGTVEECREAREKQRGKKPIMKPFYEDMEEEYLCCPACGDVLTDRIPFDNKDFYFHCLNCGQFLDWSDTP